MASTEEQVLRSLLGIPTKGTIGDLRKAYWNGMKSGTLGGPPVVDITQAAYDALAVKKTGVLYAITG